MKVKINNFHQKKKSLTALDFIDILNPDLKNISGFGFIRN